MRGLSALLRRAVVVAALVPLGAPAQPVPERVFEGASTETVLDALYRACVASGLSAEQRDGPMLVCSANATGDERVLEGVAIATVHGGSVSHHIRFAFAERSDGVRVWTNPWIEVAEPEGIVLDETLGDEGYLARVQSVLERIDSNLRADEADVAEPWAERYESEEDWRLAAHLRAVDHCDRSLPELDSEVLERRLELAGVRPFSRGVRGRCEELYEPVFEWALARGIRQPTVEAYAEHPDGGAAARRSCTARLGLADRCP